MIVLFFSLTQNCFRRVADNPAAVFLSGRRDIRALRACRGSGFLKRLFRLSPCLLQRPFALLAGSLFALFNQRGGVLFCLRGALLSVRLCLCLTLAALFLGGADSVQYILSHSLSFP